MENNKDKYLLIIGLAVMNGLVVTGTGFGSNTQNAIDCSNMSIENLKILGASLKSRLTARTSVFEMEQGELSLVEKRIQDQFNLVEAIYSLKMIAQKEDEERSKVAKEAKRRLSQLRTQQDAKVSAEIEKMTDEELAAAIAAEEAKLSR